MYYTHTGSRPVSQDKMYYTHMGSRPVSQVVSQPERIMVDVVKTGIAMKSLKEKAVKVDVTGYVSNMELTNIDLVSDSFVCVFSRACIILVAPIVSYKAYSNC